MSSGYNVTPETVNNAINQIENLFLSASESSFGYTQQNETSTLNNHTIKNTKMKPWFNRDCHEVRNL